MIIIDEAQKIPGIGAALKIMVDIEPNIQIIATGSSTFELAGQTGEPLTGRKTTLNLYPISIFEQVKLNQVNIFDLKNKLIKDYLIYGLYPETLQQNTKDDKKQYLQELIDSYLLKDILAFEKVKKSKVLLDLLRLIAFQIGSEVSTTELAQKLGISSKTVKRYLDLLEKSFVIFNLRGFSRNLRKEITKMSKYFFYDNGVLNSIISNFNPIDIRNDVGQLWENFIIAERIKKQQYANIFVNNYFWRTWDQKEIDFVEEREGNLYGYEMKWDKNKKPKAPTDWKESYENTKYRVINKDNFVEFVA
jgi:hypothetical protein